MGELGVLAVSLPRWRGYGNQTARLTLRQSAIAMAERQAAEETEVAGWRAADVYSIEVINCRQNDTSQIHMLRDLSLTTATIRGVAANAPECSESLHRAQV
jgi:hypothetical protein